MQNALMTERDPSADGIEESCVDQEQDGKIALHLMASPWLFTFVFVPARELENECRGSDHLER